MKYFVELGDELREFRSEAECRAVIVLNDRLNKSEKALRQTLPGSAVDLLVERFKAAATPALFTALYAKRDPYRWLAQHWAPKQPPTTH